MKIKVWYHISDGADYEFQEYGQAFDENVDWLILDTDNFTQVD